jgi:hypothetical protein
LNNEHRDLWWESPTIERGKVIPLGLPGGVSFTHGGHLPGIQVSYQCWGRLNAARDNAVLIGLYHPSHSWTGRYPWANVQPQPPRFAAFLALENRVVVLSDTPQPGAVPLLDSLVGPPHHH